MEERKKDNLASDDNYSEASSVIDIDEAINNDGIIEIEDSDGIDYDQEYMTNVSDNLVSEVDKVLKSEEEINEEPLKEVKEEAVAEEPAVNTQEPVKETPVEKETVTPKPDSVQEKEPVEIGRAHV